MMKMSLLNTPLTLNLFLNKIDAIIDGGYGDNVASTIIDLSNGTPVVIREGKGEIEGIL